MPIQLPDENPLIGQRRRQAHASVAGYVYQIHQAVLRWIKLDPSEALFLEGVEDCDILSAKDPYAQTWQFKVRADSISLGRAEIVEAINNYWQSVASNTGIRCELRYVTTSPVVAEKGNPFGPGTSGIRLWEAAKTDIKAAETIRKYRHGHYSHL